MPTGLLPDPFRVVPIICLEDNAATCPQRLLLARAIGRRLRPHQKKCNQPYLEPVRVDRDSKWNCWSTSALGELEGFEALFRQFQGEVYRWILRIVRDSGVAEDLTVETFWRIYRARARFDPSRSFGPWARRIDTNVALDYLKTVRPEASLSGLSRSVPMAPVSLRQIVSLSDRHSERSP
jgi:hypothetical protein